MRVERLTDPEQIKKIFNHPKISKHISDDLTPDNFEPDIARTIFLGIFEDDKLLGIVSLEPFTNTTSQIHFCILPSLYGRLSDIKRVLCGWANTNTSIMKVVGFVPACNKLMVRAARTFGMVEEGRITKSFLQNWKLHDQIVFGFTKQQWNDKI